MDMGVFNNVQIMYHGVTKPTYTNPNKKAAMSGERQQKALQTLKEVQRDLLQLYEEIVTLQPLARHVPAVGKVKGLADEAAKLMVEFSKLKEL